MKRSKAAARKNTKPEGDSTTPSPFRVKKGEEPSRDQDPQVHVYGKGVICETDKRGYPTSRGRSTLEIVVDASEGFIPLWAKGTILRWRFQERSMRRFADVEGAKAAIRRLMGDALLAWGGAVPVKFAERQDACDFEIVTRRSTDCDNSGCVLASAFFPDAGQHRLVLYPTMFEETRKEQVDTLVHELGHVFGLRHFFAQIEESDSPSEVFGVHRSFSIMNYGPKSKLTKDDRADLKKLYRQVWSGARTEINGTPIRLVRPFSTTVG